MIYPSNEEIRAMWDASTHNLGYDRYAFARRIIDWHTAKQREGMIRYCPECGKIGEVGEEFLDCCPDGIRHQYVRPEIAKQANAGFSRPIPAAPVAPEGWKLVPVAPTVEIIQAAQDYFVSHDEWGFSGSGMYRAMLAAAPEPKE